jgi:hypothetical protein
MNVRSLEYKGLKYERLYKSCCWTEDLSSSMFDRGFGGQGSGFSHLIGNRPLDFGEKYY